MSIFPLQSPVADMANRAISEGGAFLLCIRNELLKNPALGEEAQKVNNFVTSLIKKLLPDQAPLTLENHFSSLEIEMLKILNELPLSMIQALGEKELLCTPHYPFLKTALALQLPRFVKELPILLAHFQEGLKKLGDVNSAQEIEQIAQQAADSTHLKNVEQLVEFVALYREKVIRIFSKLPLHRIADLSTGFQEFPIASPFQEVFDLLYFCAELFFNNSLSNKQKNEVAYDIFAIFNMFNCYDVGPSVLQEYLLPLKPEDPLLLQYLALSSDQGFLTPSSTPPNIEADSENDYRQTQ